jgi:hypothetical protein
VTRLTVAPILRKQYSRPRYGKGPDAVAKQLACLPHPGLDDPISLKTAWCSHAASARPVQSKSDVPAILIPSEALKRASGAPQDGRDPQEAWVPGRHACSTPSVGIGRDDLGVKSKQCAANVGDQHSNIASHKQFEVRVITSCSGRVWAAAFS